MAIINIMNFRDDVFTMLENTIKYNDPLTVTTKVGNAVILSEEDYRSLMETLYLISIPEVKMALDEGKEAPLSECIPEDEVEW